MPPDPLAFVFPAESYVRLKVIARLTGTPEATMRDACRLGQMDSRIKVGTYYARLIDHDAWVCGGAPLDESEAAPRLPAVRSLATAGVQPRLFPPSPPKKRKQTKRVLVDETQGKA